MLKGTHPPQVKGSQDNLQSREFPSQNTFLCLLTLLALSLLTHQPLSNPGGSLHLIWPPLHNNGIQRGTVSLITRPQVSCTARISFINMFLQLFPPISHRISLTPSHVLSCHPQIIQHSRPKSSRSSSHSSWYPYSRTANLLGLQIPGHQ